MIPWVYKFGNRKREKAVQDPKLLGGKGANLSQMCNLGLPVPPGFTITTQVCTFYYSNGQYPENLKEQVYDALEFISKETNRNFGNAENNPLLLSVRSGARISMPGMMDTVLNLGLNDHNVKTLANQMNERFAYDSYRRFIQMYGSVVLGIDHYNFEKILEDVKDQYGFSEDSELEVIHLQEIIDLYKEKVKELSNSPFPQDVYEQLWKAIGAVFSSWMTPRAKTYRRLNAIPQEWGTAVNVQAMVFGNMGNNSATGVAFTRNPSTGENKLYGEFLVNAQGEDVVAGIRTPQNLTEDSRIEANSQIPSLEKLMPKVFKEFQKIAKILETHYRDMQDLEFTIEDGKLWFLQTRSGKRTAQAALKIAVDLVNEGVLTIKESILRIDPSSLDQLLHPTIDPDAKKDILVKGLPASPGAAMGEIVFSADEAETASHLGRKVILVRIETSPEDIHGMHASEAILTARGGMTSHAAVVARGMGKPCVCGVSELKIDYKQEILQIKDKIFKKGEIITLDGSLGEVYAGKIAMREPDLSENFQTIMGYADKIRRMEVRANAETPMDAEVARNFGAQGIGLCRTEHMFFAEDRILAMQEMILSDTQESREKALSKLLPMQRSDFVSLFNIMKGLPVTIRLLDPPLHEFLPKSEKEITEVAKLLEIPKSHLENRIESLHEFNPMLGLRGCRLAITYPEIARMQARAIFEAVVESAKTTNSLVKAEIMIPLVGDSAEFLYVKKHIDEIAKNVMEEQNISFEYTIGTMIELPRAALCADEIAKDAQFFSFGTNDLTQTTFGISRDDAGSFLSTYVEKDLYKEDPFVSLDQKGVGKLMKIAKDLGRKENPELKIGICGEHGGDSKSIDFCESLALDYVSCSPFRVPIARLSAARATILHQREK